MVVVCAHHQALVARNVHDGNNMLEDPGILRLANTPRVCVGDNWRLLFEAGILYREQAVSAARLVAGSATGRVARAVRHLECSMFELASAVAFAAVFCSVCVGPN